VIIIVEVKQRFILRLPSASVYTTHRRRKLL